MSKKRSVYMCQECGYDSVKWSGKCPGCGLWNTMVEEIIRQDKKDGARKTGSLTSKQPPVPINEVDMKDSERILTGSTELDRVLGQGMMPGSVVLMVGDPGIGKSSLTLQMSGYTASKEDNVLYVTGEESIRQIRLRADRLGVSAENLYVLSETNLLDIETYIEEVSPSLLVVDSIQTMYRPEIDSAPGSVSQVREVAGQLLRITKNQGFSTVIVGHVTKDGTMAGPRVLEHIVDTVLYFEGERNTQYRIIRAIKNRFGSTNEIGLFEMTPQGLKDVPDASLMFLAERAENVSGSVIIPTMEGSRPVLVEVQTLISPSPFVPPRRTSDCVDHKRIQLLLAVLEKRIGFQMGNMDVFVKVAGGIYVEEPAVDLGLAVAMASSHRDIPVESKTVVLGEVGLAGEIRAIARLDQRLREAERMGFTQAFVPESNLQGKKELENEYSITLTGIKSLKEALTHVLGI